MQEDSEKIQRKAMTKNGHATSGQAENASLPRRRVTLGNNPYPYLCPIRHLAALFLYTHIFSILHFLHLVSYIPPKRQFYRPLLPFFLLTALPVPFCAVVLIFSRTSKSSAPELLEGTSSSEISDSSSSADFLTKRPLSWL
jgi:hypothetical protein